MVPSRGCESVFVTVLSVLALSYGESVTHDNVGLFWHVTDFHYDHTYLTSQPLSCNNNITSLPPLGSYWCDSTWVLVTKAVDFMVKQHPQVDFILWTGDTVAHISDTALNVTVNVDVMKNVTGALSAAFNATPVYSAFGNHDYFPANQFPASATAGLQSAIYNATADLWRHWIADEDQIENFRKGGYYTRLLPHNGQRAKLRVVLLNTNLYYTSNKQTPGVEDPADQMTWFNDTLNKARHSQEKVIVAAHIPPGIHTPRGVQWYQERFVLPFNALLQQHADLILAMHFGHDHHDGFKVFPGNSQIPLFVAPSVTPWRFKLSPTDIGPPHNPSLRLVTFDRDTGRHLNILQYYLNMTSVAAGTTPDFALLYNFTQHYNVSDLSAASLNDAIVRMTPDRNGNSPLLDQYFSFSLAGANDSCDESCRRNIMCGFKLFTLDQYRQCVSQTPTPDSGHSAPTVTVSALTTLTQSPASGHSVPLVSSAIMTVTVYALTILLAILRHHSFYTV